MFAEIMNRHTDPTEENDDIGSQSGKESLDGNPTKKNASKVSKRNSFSYFDGTESYFMHEVICIISDVLFRRRKRFVSKIRLVENTTRKVFEVSL